MNIKLITAASESYSKNVLGLIGSLNLNWPNHPQVVVYDLGMEDSTRERLIDNAIEVIKVPPFCPHWRKHFTWKIWCWNNVDADIFIYMDAGLVVLQPLDELIEMIEKIGYAVFPNYRLLENEASIQACKGCEVDPDFRIGKGTIAGNLVGFNKKNELIKSILDETFRLSLIEDNLKAFLPTHRHDQALLSLVMYKYLSNPILLDASFYLGHISPVKVPGQKVWACRQYINESDLEYLSNFVNGAADPKPYIPQTSPKNFGFTLFEFKEDMQRIYGKSETDLGRQLLRNDLGKIGSEILNLLLKTRAYLRPLWHKTGKVDEIKPKIYDGVKD